MAEFRLVVAGEPIPKMRPRFNTKTGTACTPKPTREYELMVSMMALAQRVRFGTSPVKVTLQIFTQKTNVDSDNVLKSVLDSLQIAGVFDNDRQVIEHNVCKITSTTPRIEVEVTKATERTEVPEQTV